MNSPRLLLVLLGCSVSVAAISAQNLLERSIFGAMAATERADHEAAALRLWEGPAPAALGEAPADVPLLYPLRPAAGARETRRPALIVLAGGSYRFHSAAEAFPIAEQFREAGMAAFVLRYRLAPAYDPMVVALADVQRAVRVLRARAGEMGVDPERIAVLGFSAGGHLAAHLSVRGDDGQAEAADPIERASCRVRTVVLFYPGILAPGLPNPRAERALGWAIAQPGLHRLVDARTPPTFMITGYDDAQVPYDNCLVHAARLHEAGVRFELHLLGAGGHGGQVREARRAEWTPLVMHWLADVGVLAPDGKEKVP
ncbi:MAG: alpha/beta hydrolase [Opitutaceae bacterium]